MIRSKTTGSSQLLKAKSDLTSGSLIDRYINSSITFPSIIGGIPLEVRDD